MTMAQPVRGASGRLAELAGRLHALPGFADVVASLRRGHGATLGGVWGSSCALVAAALAEAAEGPLVIICPHPGDIDSLADDLRLFLGGDEAGSAIAKFPAHEAFSREATLSDEVYGDRLRLLKELARAGKPGSLTPRFIVTSIQSLLQPVPGRELVARQTRVLRRGQAVDLDEFSGWLVAQGFHNTTG